MRINTTLKLHGLKGPRIFYPLQEADVREVEYAYLTADGIAIPDGSGKILWVDTIVTTDAGGARIYDETSAAGETLVAAYGAKKDDSVVKNYDPPLPYHHGVYVDLTDSIVRICYKPFGRNLRCSVTAAYAPATLNLVCRVNVYYIPGSKTLLSRVTVVYAAGTLNLQSRVTVVYAQASKDLTSRVTVMYAGASSDLPARTEVLKVTSLGLTSRVETYKAGSIDLPAQLNVVYISGNKWMYSQVTVTH